MFRNRLHVYTVHINPSTQKPYENAKFIEDGFNIKAFIFSAAWALYFRLWWVALAIIIGNAIIFQLGDGGTLSELGKTVMQLGFNLIIGFEANDWRRRKLARQGYIMTDIITGDSLVRAEQRFYDHYFDTLTSSAA